MSSMLYLFDLGLQVGVLGAFHSLDHTGESTDVHARRNHDLLARTCGNHVTLTYKHEPRRVRVFDVHPSVYIDDCSRWLKSAASGVLLTRAFMDAANTRTIAMPVTDHTIVSAQVLDAEDCVLAFAMARVTQDRAYGSAGEVTALLDALDACELHRPIALIRFHLSAGRGPCCLPLDIAYLDGIKNTYGDPGIDLGRFISYDSEHGRPGIDMVKILEMDIERQCADRYVCEVHTRDNDCTVCCAKHHGMPYYSPEDKRHNLAFVSTELQMPLSVSAMLKAKR